ncbi:MAG: hypothetical protein PHH09_14255 [Methanoregulaceae archaeon]|nr:hypothetical protein [Methanoregulaceae archaeon]
MEFKEDHIKNFNLSAPDGMCLSGFSATNLPGDSNNTYTLNAYGKIYNFNINCSKHWGWWTYNLKLRHPNGTTESKIIEKFAPLATDYDIRFQYYYMEGDNVFDIDIYTALVPLSATFESDMPSKYYIDKFSYMAGSSTAFFNLIIYASTDEEFKDQSNQSLGRIFTHAADEVFSWAWENILSFVEKIPGIGPQFATALIIATSLVSMIFFYFDLFFIEYLETTLLTLEFFILSYSIINTRTSKGPTVLIKNIVKNHITVFEFIIEKSQSAVNLVMDIISAVATAVNALKP